MKYEYLNDRVFLKKIDELKVKEYFSKIILIDQNENEIGEQTDSIISGNINIDGNSTIRRTCNLSVAINEQLGDIEDAKSIFSIGTKLKIEVGIKNTTSFYPNFDIVWFPVGVYVICDASASYSNSGYTIDLQLKDKMCLLNGECGGTLPASVTFDKEESYDSSTDTIVTKRPTIYQLINEIVNHWGGEQLGNIIVNDIDEKIKRVVSITKTGTFCTFQKTFDVPNVWHDQETAFKIWWEKIDSVKSENFSTDIFKNTWYDIIFNNIKKEIITNDYLGKTYEKVISEYWNYLIKNFNYGKSDKALDQLFQTYFKTESTIITLLTYCCEAEKRKNKLILPLKKDNPNFINNLNKFLDIFSTNFLNSLKILPTTKTPDKDDTRIDLFFQNNYFEKELCPSLAEKGISSPLNTIMWKSKNKMSTFLQNKYINDVEDKIKELKMDSWMLSVIKFENRIMSNTFTNGFVARIKDGCLKLRENLLNSSIITPDYDVTDFLEVEDTYKGKISGLNPLNFIVKDFPRKILNYIKDEQDKCRTTIKKAFSSIGKKSILTDDQIQTMYQYFKNSPQISQVYNIEETKTDIGYEYVDFVYNQDLIIDAGGTVCDALDKIKNYLGNYEYFYDEEGHFVFQEIKNYINTSLSSIAEETGNYNELLNNPQGYKYEFNNSNIVATYTKAPQYNLVKNDFLIWGIKDGTSSDSKVPIRYHLAIDEKPVFDMSFLKNKAIFAYCLENSNNGGLEIRVPKRNSQGLFYNEVADQTLMYTDNTDKDMIYKVKVFKGKQNLTEEEQNLHSTYFDFTPLTDKTFSENNPLTSDNQTEVCLYFLWNKDYNKWDLIDTGKFYYFITNQQYESKVMEKKQSYCIIDNNNQPLDWRTQIYLFGLFDESSSGFDNYYYTELVNEWNKIYEFFPVEKKEDYNIIALRMKEDIQKSPTRLEYFLDLISSTSKLNQFSVQNIGRRTKVINEDDINCIFEPNIEEVYFIRSNDPDLNNIIQKCGDAPYYIIDDNNFDTYFSTGGTFNSAYNQARNLLLQSTSYNSSITMTTLPIYYLDVNSKIFVSEEQAHINDQYMISNISYSLDGNATMTISATQLIDNL